MSKQQAIGYGVGAAAIQLAPVPIIAERDPTSTDTNYDIGQDWINKITKSAFTYFGGGTWSASAGGSTDVNTLTDTSGTVVSPTAGNIQLAGTANQVTATAGSNKITFSLPSALTAPGSVTATTTLTATSGNITATNGDFVSSTAGKGLKIKEGSNARMGTATLVAGTVTVANTSVTANTRVFLSRYSINASTAVGTLTVGTVTANTSFVINSVQAATPGSLQTNDVSIVHWLLIEPSP